jgi:hypothetical protein
MNNKLATDNDAELDAIEPVLPTGRIFGRITQKGPVKNMCGRAN